MSGIATCRSGQRARASSPTSSCFRSRDGQVTLRLFFGDRKGIRLRTAGRSSETSPPHPQPWPNRRFPNASNAWSRHTQRGCIASRLVYPARAEPQAVQKVRIPHISDVLNWVFIADLRSLGDRAAGIARAGSYPEELGAARRLLDGRLAIAGREKEVVRRPWGFSRRRFRPDASCSKVGANLRSVVGSVVEGDP